MPDRPACDAFLDALPAAERARWAAVADDALAAIDAHWQSGRVAWPGVELPLARFAAELGRRLSPDATLAEIGRLFGADLYLAIAGGAGDRAAIAHCERAHLSVIDAVAARLRASDHHAAEVRSDLRSILFVGEPGRPAASDGYGGRGELRAYVSVIATRALIRAINRGRRMVQLDDNELVERIGLAGDPELSALRALYRDDVAGALGEALAGLDPRARALLRFQLVDGLSLDDVGKLYDVHRTTAFRWLQKAREDLGERIRGALAARLSVPTGEVDSIVRLVQSRVEVSIERLLATGGDATPD